MADYSVLSDLDEGSLSNSKSGSDLNFVDSNGVNHDNYNSLPNNNICGNISECYNTGDESENTEGQGTNPEDSHDSSESTSTANFQQDSQSGEVHGISGSLDHISESAMNSGDISDSIDSDRTLVQCNDNQQCSNGAVLKSKPGKTKKNSSLGRGRPRKGAIVAMYHSQISGDKNAIKIRIKKSNFSTQVKLTPNKKKSGRRKKHKTSDTETSDHELKIKKSKSSVNSEDKKENDEPQDQSTWGSTLPPEILHNIFELLTEQEGALPTLVRMCRVCRLWRKVAMQTKLWKKVDLNWVKERSRTDMILHWLIQNRLRNVQDLNLGEWKIRDIQLALEAISESCPELIGLNLSGWKGLNADNLKYITTEYGNLQRLDLSSINSTSAINAQPLVNLGQTMSSRLTHLVLAHNKIAGFTQIMSSISSNCPNLELLDISNIRTFAHNTALLHIEKLQTGCPKLRVLRITNSQIWLAPATIPEQIASPGFPALEELSLAGIEDDKTTTARCVNDDGIERILKNSTKLRLLDIRGCIRLTDSGLVKVSAWDLEHLFLSACYITRAVNSGLELILTKWSHSLLEVDLAWSTATTSLDAAVLALAEKEDESPLRIINLCGSSVSLDPVRKLLIKCPNLYSINLQSCRALPRGIKRLYTGAAIQKLRQSLEDKPKTEDSSSEADKTGTEASINR